MWNILLRVGVILSTALTIKEVMDLYQRDIVPHRIYSSKDAASILGVERIEVVTLIRNGELKAHMVDGYYRITGGNILGYLGKK
jgi:excisionase family DNA binding protein